MKTEYVMLGAVALIGVISISSLAFTQQQTQIQLNNQQTALNDWLKFQGAKAYIGINGNDGLFDGKAEMLFVKTNHTSKDICLLFLHELGHKTQWANKDPCFYDKDLTACEKQAITYATENAFRCEGLN
jgi:hypothetical protein